MSVRTEDGSPAAVELRDGVRELVVDAVTLRFGGITALDDVTFTVAPGTVHALIGPNGAGKSSCFNVISGLYRPTAGRVRLGDDVLTSLAPHRLAALGVGRSFQNIALSPGSTVRDNVMLGRHVLTSGGFLAGGLRLTVRTERRHVARAEEICDFLGVADRLDQPVAALPYGVAKRVDIARALAVEPTLAAARRAGRRPERHRDGGDGRHDPATCATRSASRCCWWSTTWAWSWASPTGSACSTSASSSPTGCPSEVQTDPDVISAYLGTGAEDEETP